MNDVDTATSETSPKDKNEDKKELPTLPAETSIDDSKKSAKEKKVVVVKPREPDVKISDASDHSEEVSELAKITDKVKGKLKGAKDKVASTTKEGAGG